LSHNFGSRYVRKLIKGSKDSDDNHVFPWKTWAKKMACWVGAQGQKTKIFDGNVYIRHPGKSMGFPLTYIYVGQ